MGLPATEDLALVYAAKLTGRSESPVSDGIVAKLGPGGEGGGRWTPARRLRPCQSGRFLALLLAPRESSRYEIWIYHQSILAKRMLIYHRIS